MDSRQLQLILSLRDNASKELQRVSGELGKADQLTAMWDSTLQTVKRSLVAVGAAGIAGLGWGVKIAADLQTAEIGLTTLLGSAEEARSTVERLKIEAARTPFELPGLTKATQLLTAVTKDGDKSIDILLDVGEGLAAMGKGQSELDRIIVNLQQIGAVGKASMIDVKQFAFAGLPIYEMLQETTGATGEALTDLISSGGVTFDMLVQMFDEANDEGGKFFNAFQNQSGSFNQALSNMKDSAGIFFADLATNTGLVDFLTAAMIRVSEIMGDWRGTLESVTNYVRENGLVFSILGGMILGVLVPALIAATISFGTLAVAALAAFGAMLLAAAPFIIAGGIIAGLAYLIINNWGGIKDFFVGLWDTVTSATSDAMTGISNFISTAWEVIKTVFFTAINFIIGAYATLFDFMFPGWQENFKLMLDLVLVIFTAIGGYISNALAFIGGALGTWLGGVREMWSSAWTFVSELFTNIWENIKAVFTSAKDGIINTMEAMLAPIQKVIDLAQRALELGGKAISAVGRSVSGGVQSIIDRGATISGRATGGAVTGGTEYVVGEMGPEIFRPATAGMIVPNHDLNQGGSGMVVNVYGDVTGEELVEKVKRAMAGNLKEMIRV